MLHPKIRTEKNRVEIIQTKVSSEKMYDEFIEFLKQKEYSIRQTPSGYIAGRKAVYFIISRGDWVSNSEKDIDKIYSTLVVRLAETAPKGIGLEEAINQFTKKIQKKYKLPQS